MKQDNMTTIQGKYDLVVVGGGVTGAGVFHRAVQQGFSALLVEANDFAWGTSSRSSKMVHGGLRYLKQGKFLLTRSAVRERQRLLGAYPGLVTPLEFIMPIYEHHGPSRSSMKVGLSIYSLMAGEKQHQSFPKSKILEMVPGIRSEYLKSGVGFKDAQVDDARLVLRLIFDGCDLGGKALNYTKADSIERNAKGNVAAVNLRDTETGTMVQVKTSVVINATGAFAETLHPSPLKDFHIRPLRGSHLVFPGDLVPLSRVISFFHPRDKRPVFFSPWEGFLFLGTTDIDHEGDMLKEPCITMDEADYLMEGLAFILPNLQVSLSHCISSIAGIRPVLSKRKRTASKESREHVVWKNKGLVTVTGGKLTTFSLLAADALKEAGKYLPQPSASRLVEKNRENSGPVYDRDMGEYLMDVQLSLEEKLRLTGRYGTRTADMAAICAPKEFLPLANTHTLWAELFHGAKNEQIRHLSDLMLRRVRLGLFLPNGGMDILDEIENRIGPFLAWDRAQWARERRDYEKLWQTAYAPPARDYVLPAR